LDLGEKRRNAKLESGKSKIGRRASPSRIPSLIGASGANPSMIGASQWEREDQRSGRGSAAGNGKRQKKSVPET
jgi:hypothetical protein